MKNNRKHLAIVSVLVAIGTVVTYFLLTAIYKLPVAASQEAQQIQPLFNFHFMAISFLFALIMVFLLYTGFVFRRQPDDDEDGPHVHGNTVLEIVWTILPFVVVIALGIWGTILLADITEAEENELVVNVTGRQWSWVFNYPDYPDAGNTTELVLPVDRQVRLEMSSQDVLHSFWVPEFRVKQDLVPDTKTILRIKPILEGDYKVRCAEICGELHSTMLATVSVVNQGEFEQWLADQAGSIAQLTPEERGEKWAVEYGCTACHSIDGSTMAGPTWLGLYGSSRPLDSGESVTADEAYLQESILNPGANVVAGFQNNVMPQNFEERFAERQAELMDQGIDVDIVADLIAYIALLEQ